MADCASGDKGKAKSSHHEPLHHVGQVVKQAEKGFSSNGDNYDAHRPGYTESVVNQIAEIICGTSSTLKGDFLYNVLELGAGTGKMTEQLIKMLPASTKYLATDQSNNFLDTLESKNLGVDVRVASADNLALPDSSVQTVVCAQCFHWFADTPNLESIRRVMVPGGKLVLVWNVNNLEDSWMKQMGEQRCRVIERVGGNLKHLVNTGEWRRDIDKSSLFSLDKYLTLPGNNVVGNMERIISNIGTISAYNMLPEEERKTCFDELRQIIGTWPGVNTDNVTMLMSTLLVIYEAR